MGSSGFSWKLEDHPKLEKGKIIAMIVLDGWGEANPDQYNCIHVAETPVMDSLKQGAPDRWRLVRAHGKAVGLPTEDDMGNSEVGHNALGAGRIYAQGAKLVDLALESGKIYDGEGFSYIKESFETGTLHLIGLLSDGGVHSRLDQLQLLIKGASDRGAKRIRVHILTDGRDVLDGSSVGFVETLENHLSKLRETGVDAQIASGGGRMYVTMDRYENDWNVVKRGWDAQVLGEAPYKFQSALEAVKKLREAPKANDQYLPPFVIVDKDGKAVGPIVDGDAVVTVNFRADRMTMLAKALEYENFDKFDRVRFPKIRYAGMLQYDGELKLPNRYLVSPPEIERTSGEYLTHNGVRTFACSETVKFGHVTFFWNGNRSGYFNADMEEYVEIPSDSGITFNEQPKMKALEIAEKARDAILSRKFHQVRVNLPNSDMVGHTGDIGATVVACKRHACHHQLAATIHADPTEEKVSRRSRKPMVMCLPSSQSLITSVANWTSRSRGISSKKIVNTNCSREIYASDIGTPRRVRRRRTMKHRQAVRHIQGQNSLAMGRSTLREPRPQVWMEGPRRCGTCAPNIVIRLSAQVQGTRRRKTAEKRVRTIPIAMEYRVL